MDGRKEGWMDGWQVLRRKQFVKKLLLSFQISEILGIIFYTSQ